jgi:hypothetical protein
VTAEPMRTINQSKAQNFLGKAAGGCGGALNSFLIAVGDKCGLYPTSQYRCDVEEPIVRSKAPSIVQKRTSSRAAAGAHGSASPGKDWVISVQREEAAFMTLVCHDCAAATDEI